jgi:ubiquinone/menaquinone biosynthesis C-methylase UbiE
MAPIQPDIQHDASTDRPSDPLRDALRRMWASVAPSWSQHATYVDARGAAVAQAMLDAAGVRAGDHVLELACGPGGVGISAAERVGPTGSVVLSDVTAEMTSVAAARATALELTNVTTCELDLEHIDQTDCSHDVVLCREGLMLVPEPARAFREIRRVLRPGGRAAVAVWGPQERNPWLGVLFDAISSHIGVPVPPPGIPGPFSLADTETLTALMVDANFADIAVAAISTPLRVTSFEEWWTTVPSLAGPIAGIIASLPQEAADAIGAGAHQGLEGFISPNGYELPGLSLVASGTRRYVSL